jgi:DNA-binding CsgD family transcriptional regulator
MIHLSPQQYACVALVARGMTASEIASELGLAQNTVKAHLQHARDKTGARNRIELALMFVRGAIRQPALREAA